MSKTVTRFGKAVPADVVFDAWTSNDLAQMVAAASLQSNAVDRHHLLGSLVAALYQRREADGVRDTLFHYCALHIDELPVLLQSLREHEQLTRAARAEFFRKRGKLIAAEETEAVEPMAPVVDTFMLACRAHCEIGHYEQADAVWAAAHSMGYIGDDGLEHELAGVQKRKRKTERAAPKK
jgi:hypothetical protein